MHEGGVRNNCVLHSSAFPVTWHGRVYPGLVHLVDLHAMILGLVGTTAKHKALDGIDFFEDMSDHVSLLSLIHI